MKPSLRTPKWAIALLVLAPAVACVSGNDDHVSIGDDCEDGFCSPDGGPTFTPPPAEGGDAGEASVAPGRILACVGTECPAPWATCLSNANISCGTNLLDDRENCGACGKSCGSFVNGLNMGSRCVNGACALECVISAAGDAFRDCNGILDDGCEVNASVDPKNCGLCGHACADGEPCIDGMCGCPSPKIACGRTCIDPRSDDSNCNACGNVCHDPPLPCNPMPARTKYGCVARQCEGYKCEGGYADCNHDTPNGCSSDGCETSITTTKDCGGCGIACAPGEECKVDQGVIECRASCATMGLAKCGDDCEDLLNDPLNCGACGVGCAGRPNQSGLCKKGVCALECTPGFADCNADPADGCEVDLSSHPANCGACGHECDLHAGQPCIEGKCLMVECDGGVVAK